MPEYTANELIYWSSKSVKDELLFDYVSDYINNGKDGININPDWYKIKDRPNWKLFYFLTLKRKKSYENERLNP